MNADQLRLFLADLRTSMITLTGRPFIEIEINSVFDIAIEEASTLALQLQSKGYSIGKVNPPAQAEL